MLELPFEIWRDIPGFNGEYQASTMGNIRSTEKYVNCTLGKKHVKSIRYVHSTILKQFHNVWGYLCVGLYKNGKRITKTVHRLVADTFLPNPNNLPEVNHKDEDKENCQISNLEWCSSKYNCNYGTRNERASKQKAKPVAQYTLNGELIRIWEGAYMVERYFGFCKSNIIACCKNKYGYKTAYGFKWEYYVTKRK